MANLIIISLKHDERKWVLSRSIERQLVHLFGLQKVDLWCGNGKIVLSKRPQVTIPRLDAWGPGRFFDLVSVRER